MPNLGPQVLSSFHFRSKWGVNEDNHQFAAYALSTGEIFVLHYATENLSEKQANEPDAEPEYGASAMEVEAGVVDEQSKQKPRREWLVAALKVPSEYTLVSAERIQHALVYKWLLTRVLIYPQMVARLQLDLAFYGEVVGAPFHNEECLVLLLGKDGGGRAFTAPLACRRIAALPRTVALQPPLVPSHCSPP
jgi:hypothetical protein